MKARRGDPLANAPAPKVGEFYLVTWRDTENTAIAEIIERRPVRESTKKPSSSKKSGKAAAAAESEDGQPPFEVKQEAEAVPADAKAKDLEYYVHYCDYDRRLDEWVKPGRIDVQSGPQPAPESANSHGGGHGGASSSKKRKLDEVGGAPEGGGNVPNVAAAMKEHEEITKVKNIGSIALGRHAIDAWYYSPFPAEYCNHDTLYICEFCLKYFKRQKSHQRHRQKCDLRHPPGTEIYRDNDMNLSVWEIDGKTNKVYCQNLCLLAKLFLDHKTLYYDVDPFLFYVLCEVDDRGFHLVGYFSKEKQSSESYNLACILTFPPYQRHGYGKFLISLSYELTKREQKVGSPEKPLSDLGKLSYRSYWTYVLLSVLKEAPSVTLKELTMRTGIKADDIVSTLRQLNMIALWKGQHVILVNKEKLTGKLQAGKRMNLAKPECLHWEPKKR